MLLGFFSPHGEQSDRRRRMNFNTTDVEVLVVNTHAAERRAKKSNRLNEEKTSMWRKK